MSETRKLAAILAADVVGFSRLASADEDRTLARLRALRSDLIDPTTALHHGRVVKRTGDGILIEFRSVVDAVRCAIECQNGMIERNAGLPPEKRIEFRVGIHLGDVVEESDGDLMGDGVNIASRLEGIATPGAIFLSEDAYRQVKARLDVAVNDIGAQKLKNIADPVRVYSVEVGKPGERAKAAPAARRGVMPALAALAAILALAGAAAWYWTAGRPAPNVAATAPFGVPTVAILPFANVTGDPQYDTADPAHRPEDEGRRQQCADLAHCGPLRGHGRRRRYRRRAAVECRLRRHRKPGGRRRRAARDLTTRRRSFRRAPVVSDDLARARKAQHGGRRG